MRWVLVLLVVANLALFAWWQTNSGAASRAVPDELAPQRIKVVPVERLGAAAPAGGAQAPVAGLSSSLASGALRRTDAMPLSREAADEYISLVPITWPLVAVSVK